MITIKTPKLLKDFFELLGYEDIHFRKVVKNRQELFILTHKYLGSESSGEFSYISGEMIYDTECFYGRKSKLLYRDGQSIYVYVDSLNKDFSEENIMRNLFFTVITENEINDGSRKFCSLKDDKIFPLPKDEIELEIIRQIYS